MIKLPITARGKPRQATVMANFVVINGASQYNAMIRRPTHRALKAFTSIYHQKIKFPTLNDIREMKCNQYESRVAYADTMHEYDDPRRLKMWMVSQGPINEDINLRVEEEKES